MPNNLIAFCGLDCSVCPAYIATQTDDDVLREETAKGWSSADFPVTADEIQCAGCKSVKLQWKWCRQCQVRACAAERGVSTCAACADYACDKLGTFFRMAGEKARARLEALRVQDPRET